MEDASDLIRSLAWVFGAASLVFTTFLGVVLAYHWYRYAMNPTVSSIAFAAYACVSGALLFGMLAALVALST